MTAFDLAEARQILARTPRMLDAWLADLSDGWLDARESEDTWSARQVVEHLVDGEHDDWMPRTRHLLEHGESIPWEPFDRFAHLRRAPRPMRATLDAFARARASSLAELDALSLTPADLERTGLHPEFGRIALREHLATWVVHDLAHVAQIARGLARRDADAVGPWRAYLGVLRPRV
ncbi:MAG: DinB family protein [Planctomycetes bacterium]|nr:DinB family protein [Planctomycetota bacterium]